MRPAFEQGDFVVTLPRLISRYRIGDVVVVRHPVYGVIVKRIVTVFSDQAIQLTGENPRSTSTIALGNIKRSWIIGRVIWRIAA